MWKRKVFFDEVANIIATEEKKQAEKNRKLIKKEELERQKDPEVDGQMLGPAFWLWNQTSPCCC